MQEVGAIGLECASRGARKTILCDNSKEAIQIIKNNAEKTRLQNKVEIVKSDSINLLDNLVGNKFDIVFIDPPYKTHLVGKSVEKIFENNMLSTEGIIIIETDELERILKEIEFCKNNIYDIRKYGRVKLIFLRRE